jgi:CubicO group peptidase (beta-lactamase class C family)
MLAATLLGASLAITPAQMAQIDGVVTQVMRSDHIPGLSLGIARQGKVLLTRGYGVRDVARQAPADAHTIYRIGSITKQFTATLVIQEYERGALPLDAAVNGITIEQLLSQTSGIPSYTDPGQTLESAMTAQPAFTPDTQWQYSNSDYYLLGTALQDVTHESYAQLIASRISTPLKLTATALKLPSGPDAANGYTWDGAKFVLDIPGPNATPELAFSAGGLSSNVIDLLAWMYGLENVALIDADDFTMMTSTHTLRDGTPTHYGYGFFIENWYGWPVAEHPGLIDGFSGGDAMSLDDDLNIVVLSNANHEPIAPLEKSIFAILDTAKDDALVAKPSQAPENEDPAITETVRALADGLTRSTINRSLLSPGFSATLTDDAIAADAATVKPLGALQMIEFLEVTRLAGVVYEEYRASYERGQLLFTVSMRDGKVDSLSIERGR